MHQHYFEDLPLSRRILNGIEDLGFSSLFPIQTQAITPLLEGKDVIGQAHTGTGKTAAFGIPMVERLDPEIKEIQGLVLEPTRELAIQTARHISGICKYTSLKILPIYGGLFSATIDETVMTLCNRYMNNPEKILISKDEIALPQISQYYVKVQPKNKFENLCNILADNRIERAILFCRTRRETERLANKLKKSGYHAEPLHGGFTQTKRNFVVNSFRKGKLRFLIATDVAARGLDIQGITHIINYDVPLDALVYFHRIGRTARKGGVGTAITLVSYGEMLELNRIRSLTKTEIEELEGFNQIYKKSENLNKAICTNCGKECEVPFKPDPKRSIYCGECWEARKPPIERIG